jgi:prepilin-type N-terminal cleavage/methylation domain-containing protein
MKQVSGVREQVSVKMQRYFGLLWNLQPTTWPLSPGFTLIETLVAVSLLTISIIAPMALTAQSLASAYYARDEITAYYLAQEAIEALRAIRDGQILQIVQSPNGSSIGIFDPINSELNSGQNFRIDARLTDPTSAIVDCSADGLQGGACAPLQTDGTLYGYQSGWQNTNFTRTVHASYMNGNHDEVRITVTVSWQTGALQSRNFSISENLYRWVKDNAVHS